jgi:cytosine/adenosine deaminase-related metal-dependent hydrolase
MNRECDLVIRGGTILPMTDGDGWFGGDVLVRDGRIVEVTHGGTGNVRAQQTLDATDAIVLPGLVQCHVHVVQSLLRHQADEVELLEWLEQYTWPYETALDGDGVEAAAELGIAELLAGGTTTALDFGTTRHHGRVFGAAERLGIRMVSGKTHMDTGNGVPRALLEDGERSVADAEELGMRWHGAAEGRLGYAVAPRFALSCTQGLLRDCVELARSHGWLLQSHTSENRVEVEHVRQMTGVGNVTYLHQVGLTGSDVVLAHGVHLSDAEIELLARTGTRICHCPGANLKLASGIADVPALRSAGVPVVLGADGAPCNNRLSMFHEMSLAATLHGLRHGPRALSAIEVLAMATREGARALHLEHLIGTLEPGKAADVAVVDAGGWSLQPDGNPAHRLVYGATARDVRHVVVGGRAVVVDGQLTTVPELEIRDHARQAWHATRARMEGGTWH